MRQLDDFLPSYEFSELHQSEVNATPDRVYGALREVSMADIPVARALFFVRRLGRRMEGDARKPFLEQVARGAVVLEDARDEGVVLGLTGQFWRLRGGSGAPARTVEEFMAYDRPDACKAVMDLRVRSDVPGRSLLSTETRVRVPDPAARRKFRRYWRAIRPFSGLIRILLLRAARRRAEARA